MLLFLVCEETMRLGTAASSGDTVYPRGDA